MNHGDIVFNRNNGLTGKLVVKPDAVEVRSLNSAPYRWYVAAHTIGELKRAGWRVSAQTDIPSPNIADL
jgi:hypothetical protein